MIKLTTKTMNQCITTSTGPVSFFSDFPDNPADFRSDIFIRPYLTDRIFHSNGNCLNVTAIHLKENLAAYHDELVWKELFVLFRQRGDRAFLSSRNSDNCHADIQNRLWLPSQELPDNSANFKRIRL